MGEEQGKSAETRKILIVNADDFALSPEVNAGVIQAHCEGILTSTTILANGPAFAEAVSLAKSQPRLAVGIHLNIVRGQPLASPDDVFSLLGQGGVFRPFRYRRLTPLFLRHAEREYRLQIEAVLAAGIKPTHIDFEKHHAWQSRLYALACSLAREYGLPALRSLREPLVWSLRNLGWPGVRRCGMAALLRAGAAMRQTCADSVAAPDYFLGQLWIGRMDEQVWLRLAQRLPDGVSEVMTHPGLRENASAGAPMGGSWLGTARQAELSALCSPAVRKALDAAGVALADFSIFSKTRTEK